MSERPDPPPEEAAEQRPGDDSADEQARHGVSLDKLSQTFARLFASAKPAVVDSENAPAEHDPTPTLPDEVDETAIDLAEQVEAGDISPRGIVEAMLFVGSPENEPLIAERAAQLMRGVSADEVHQLITELNQQYAANRCPYEIVGEGAGYRLALRREYHGVRDRFYGRVRQARLSQAAIDVLAIVAYNEPLLADEVSTLRGRPSGAVLSQLVRRRLLRIERSEEKPRQTRYYVTPRFLELFGLESLSDLPHSQDPQPG